MSTEYNLKKLRALCLDIHDEQTAILLRSCLAEFPIPVINDFFNGPKLNKPSGPDEREWTDLVRLFFIAMAPEGSDPAKLRGTPFGRYKRETPYDPDQNDADALGVLTLYQTFKSSLLLKDIATGLGITALKIQSDHWLECYLNNPFPIRALNIYINQNRWGQNWKPLPTPLRCLEEDFSAAVDLLPDSLEHLALSFRYVEKIPKLIGNSISRLEALTSIRLEIDSLPEGIDFSKNPHLESIDLEIKKGGPKPIAGIGGLIKTPLWNQEKNFTAIGSFYVLLLICVYRAFLSSKDYILDIIRKNYPSDTLKLWLLWTGMILLFIGTCVLWKESTGIVRIILIAATIGLPLIPYMRGIIGSMALGIVAGLVSLPISYVAGATISFAYTFIFKQ